MFAFASHRLRFQSTKLRDNLLPPRQQPRILQSTAAPESRSHLKKGVAARLDAKHLVDPPKCLSPSGVSNNFNNISLSFSNSSSSFDCCKHLFGQSLGPGDRSTRAQIQSVSSKHLPMRTAFHLMAAACLGRAPATCAHQAKVTLTAVHRAGEQV